MKFRPAKFSNEKINELFSLLNQKLQDTKEPFFGQYGSELRPTTPSRWTFSQGSSILAEKKFNAFCVVEVGHTYENYPDPPSPMAQYVSIAKAKAQHIAEVINAVLDSSSDPMFSKLEAVIMNVDFQVIRTHEDKYDDGDDWYGAYVFFKIHFKG